MNIERESAMSAPTATFVAPPTTLEFDGAQDARDYLAAGRFRRLPVKGLVQRYAADETARRTA